MDRLYELPPEEFTAARDELAKRLGAEGERDEARRVRALRRPTLTAWAINRLARERSDDLEELIAVGNDLRKAQRRALSGGGAKALKDPTTRRREVQARLLAAAREILAGRGAGASEEVSDTLDAVVLDEDAAELVRAGQLTKPLPAPSSFGLSPALTVVPDEAEEADEEADGPAIDELEATADAAARDAAEFRERAARAEAEAERLREAADTAETRAKAAEGRAERARAAADRAARAASDAADELQAARAGRPHGRG